LRHRASNLHSVIKQLNKVSYWIPTLVLWKSSLLERAKMLTKIINIAVELRRLNNFSGVMAFLAGVNLACLFRLTFSFMAIGDESAQKLKELQELMDPSKSWKNYRTALKQAENKPTVPYLGLYLSDLTQIYEGNDTAEGDIIFFEKQNLVGNTIHELEQYQRSAFVLDVKEPLLTFTKGLPVLEEPDLWELSQQREPRSAKIEDLLDSQ